jgi:hypothetical protein
MILLLKMGADTMRGDMGLQVGVVKATVNGLYAVLGTNYYHGPRKQILQIETSK